MSLPDALSSTIFPISDQRSLAETLMLETSLSPDQVRHMVQVYKHFLVLQADDPGLVAPQLVGLVAWLHRRDAAAWAEFCAAWPLAVTLPALPGSPRHIRESEPARMAYIARFGVVPHPRVWPDPRRRRLHGLFVGALIAGIAVQLVVVKMAIPAAPSIVAGIIILQISALIIASRLAPWQVYSSSRRFAPPSRWFDIPQD